MAQNNVDVTNQPKVETEQERLKYLEFVQVAVLHTLVYASKAYVYAKENSGSLKPRVDTMESSLKTAVGPTYHKFHNVPVDVLKFVDRKVDESVTKFDSRVPLFVKQVSTKTKNFSSTVAADIKTTGVVETASGLTKTAYTKLEPTAKGPYTKHEPVADQYAASAWRSLNQLPLFPKVAKVDVPKAAYCSEKYNQAVLNTAEKGYKVSFYLPLVPTQRIAKVFNSVEPQAELIVPRGNEGAVVAH